MTSSPPRSSDEWSFAPLPIERRSYLEDDPPFERIAARFADESVCVFAEIDGLKKAGTGVPARTTWRGWFKVTVERPTADLLYNGRDGLRGRYWQSEMAGEAANWALIASVKDKLLRHMTAHPECLTSPDGQVIADLTGVERSLDAPSAKVWAHEERDQNFNEGPRLLVKQWSIYRPGGNWRWAPDGPLVDIKGAFLLQAASNMCLRKNGIAASKSTSMVLLSRHVSMRRILRRPFKRAASALRTASISVGAYVL